MEDNLNENIVEIPDTITEFIEEHSESSAVSDSEEILEVDSTVLDVEEQSDDDPKQEETDDEQVEETDEDVEEDIEQPHSTVIQVEQIEGSDELDITELDVRSLNMMSESAVEALLSVTPTSNDYYTFIDDSILDYFSGYMANFPLNEYCAYHLRHWVQNTQYYSYYDDYYYLFFDLENSPRECIELVKYNGQNNYVLSHYYNEDMLPATIQYGSGQGQSDLRKGVSYVQEMAFLSVLAGVLILYIVNAILRHLRS